MPRLDAEAAASKKPCRHTYRKLRLHGFRAFGVCCIGAPAEYRSRGSLRWAVSAPFSLAGQGNFGTKSEDCRAETLDLSTKLPQVHNNWVLGFGIFPAEAQLDVE